MPLKFAALARSAALVTAVALIPATTASLAQVEGRAGPEFARVLAVYQRIKASYVEPGAGHYGIFAGKSWRNNIRPLVLDFMNANAEAPKPAKRAKPKIAAV